MAQITLTKDGKFITLMDDSPGLVGMYERSGWTIGADVPPPVNHVTLYRGSDHTTITEPQVQDYEAAGWTRNQTAAVTNPPSGARFYTVLNVLSQPVKAVYNEMTKNQMVAAGFTVSNSYSTMEEAKAANPDFQQEFGYTQNEIAAGKREKELAQWRGEEAGKEFYKIGQDLFNAATGKKIVSIEEWNRDWTGRAKEVDPPTKEKTEIGTDVGQYEYDEDLTGISGFDSLTSTMKDIMQIFWSIGQADTEAARAEAQADLDKAIEEAGPYYQSLTAMAKDAATRAMTTTRLDAQSQLDSLNTQWSAIQDDLTFNREQLTLEQQAQLSSLGRQLDRSIRNKETEMQEKGLVFSSPRTQAEQELRVEHGATVESVRRRGLREARTLDVTAQRQKAEIERQRRDVERKREEGIISTARETEALVGTEALGGLPALGGVIGAIPREKSIMELDLQTAFREKYKPVKMPWTS